MAGKKTSVYIYADTARQIAEAREVTGTTESDNSIVNEAVALYAMVIKSLVNYPACEVRFAPTGWVVEPATKSIVA